MQKFKIISAFAFVYLIWGTSYLAIKVGVEYIPPILFCGLRYLLAAPLLFLIGRYLGEELPNSRAQLFWLLLTAVLVLLIPGGLVAWAQQYISSQVAALLMSSTCYWVCLFSCIGTDKERLSVRVVAGLLLGTVSLFMISNANIYESMGLGYLAVLVAAMMFALGTVVFRRCVPKQSFATSAAIHLLFAGMLMTLAGGFDLAEVSWNIFSLASLVYLALANSVVALLLYYWLLHAAPAYMAGTPNLVVPVIAIASASLFTDEVLSQVQWIGAMMMLPALALIVWKIPVKTADAK